MKWIKPKEITEVGVYWVVDLRGVVKEFFVVNVYATPETGKFYAPGTSASAHGRYLENWNSLWSIHDGFFRTALFA